jgi:uncharacterized membrane protein YfcA
MKEVKMSKLLRSPWIEILVMLFVLILSYIALVLIGLSAETPDGGMSGGTIWGWLFGFFFISFAIGMLAVIVGVGGGVLFTPFMLAFTNVDSLIVRATGLIVAMFSGLIATGPLMRKGLANLRISIYCALAYSIGAYTGAQGAIIVAQRLGEAGEGFIRLLLGLILFTLVVYFVVGGKKIEWPEVKKVDSYTKWLRLSQPYYEVSLDKVVDYPLTRAGWVLAAIMGIGLLSGFFGLGAGWAYLLAGAIIPLFAAPWLVGQVLGGAYGVINPNSG